MFCLGDWKKVVHGGPRIFWCFGLILEDYDGRIDPASITLDGFSVWAQIHKVPNLYHKEAIVDQVGRRIAR